MWPFGNDSSNLPAPTQLSSAGITFTHTITRRARRLSIKVDQAGKVTVVTPPRVPAHAVEAFVQMNLSWIQAAQQKHQVPVRDKDIVSIFGKKYTKKLINLESLPLGVQIKHDTVLLNTPELLLKPGLIWNAQHTRQLQSFLDTAARKYIRERLEQFAAKMGLTYNQVSFKRQSTRWGSCSAQKNLNFNLTLVHAPTPVIDYVIIHELAHLTHMNHSDKFWQLVAQFDPDHTVHRGWLKRNSGGMSVG